MITRATAYVTSDNQTFAELDAAIGHELSILLNFDKDATIQTEVIQVILANRDRVIDLLSTTPTSKTRARKVNGGTKKRKAAATTPGLPGATA